ERSAPQATEDILQNELQRNPFWRCSSNQIRRRLPPQRESSHRSSAASPSALRTPEISHWGDIWTALAAGDTGQSGPLRLHSGSATASARKDEPHADRGETSRGRGWCISRSGLSGERK